MCIIFYMRPLLLLLFISFSFIANAQTAKDSVTKVKTDTIAKVKFDSVAYKDSVRIDKLFSTASYPLIKRSKWSGVLAVDGITEKPDPSMKYKLLVEITGFKTDSAATHQIADELAEVGRIMNLHVAAGVPKERLEVIVVAHGPILNALLTDEEYKKKYHIANPNQDILQQLQDNNVKIIACGQALHFFEIPASHLVPQIKISISAKVALSTYRNKGFASFTGG